MGASVTFDLSDQVAIVTGGASGIGQGIVAALADAGAAVALVDIDQASMAQAVGAMDGKRVIPLQADISAWSDVDRMVGETAGAFGKVTILIHAASPSDPNGAVLDLAPEAWANVVSIILTGGCMAARAFAARVIQQGGGGKIVNIGSTVVERPRANRSAYCSAKSGLMGLTRTLALELAQYDISVNAVAPGMVQTPTLKRLTTPETMNAFLRQVPQGRIGQPEDIANAVLYMVSPGAAFITGQVLYVDGGYTVGSFGL